MSTSADGYRFDPVTNRHIFAYREQVPSWFGLKDPNTFRLDPRLVAGGAFGAIFGGFMGWMGGSILTGAIIGLILLVGIQFVQFMKDPAKPVATRPLTGKAGDGGVVVDFGAELRATEDGRAEQYREWTATHPEGGGGGLTQFDWREIASVERRPYHAVESPDAANFNAENQFKSTAARMRGNRNRELRTAECIMLVFSDGQELAIGWKQQPNEAAVLQSELREFLSQMGSIANDRQRAAARAASIAPDDAPL